MNRRQTFSALVAGLLAGRSAAATTERMKAAARLIQEQVTNGTLKGAVLRVRKGDEVLEQAFGTATPASMFLLGSITKPMVAVAVMRLVDAGKLRLADKVVQHLPEFSEGDRSLVTVQQLLTHTSGLPDQLENNAQLRASHAPLEDFVQGALRTPLLFKPGTRYHYQSMGILLAAEIVQRITGEPLPGYLAREVFAPLGMKNAVLGLGDHALSDMMPMQTEHAAPEAGAGDPAAKSWDWNSPYWRNLAAPWGGAHSTAEDLDLFLSSYLKPNNPVLTQASATTMITDLTPGLEAQRGIGFMVGPEGFGKDCTARTFGHSGSTGTLAWADPATDTTFVMLTTLPKNVSGALLLRPVADLASAAL